MVRVRICFRLWLVEISANVSLQGKNTLLSKMQQKGTEKHTSTISIFQEIKAVKSMKRSE